MITFNLKIAGRNLWKNKIFSAINVIGLALSMACCLVISLYLWNELKHDSFHKNSKSIFRVTEKQDQAGSIYNVAVTPGPLAPALQKDFPEIKHAVRFANWEGMIKLRDRSYEEKNIKLTDNSIFNIFDFPLIKGNPATALRSPNDVVITERIAEKYFGKDWRNNSSVLEQSIIFNNEPGFKIVGIAKNLPANSSIQFDILIPLSYLFLSDKWSYKWNSNNYHTYLQLKPGTDVLSFSKKIANKLSAYNNGATDLLLLQPLNKQYLYSDFAFNTDWGKRSNIKYLKIFTGVGLLLLLIASVNFINLSTARSLKRSMEVGIRKVNGASPRQLIVQFLSESVMVACIAGCIGIILLVAAKPLIEKYIGISLNTNFSQSIILPSLAFFILAIGLLAGLYPAFILSRFSTASIFRKAVKFNSGKVFRQSLVVTQFAISITLIICVFYMYRQLQFVQQKDLGFDKEQLITIRLKGALMQKAGLFKHDVDRLPGIVATSPATISLVNVDNSSYVEWEGMNRDDQFLISQANVTPDFIPALEMKLLSGNNFSSQKSNDTSTFILNEAAVKRMGYTNVTAIGKELNFWGAKGKVIAVVKDFHFKPLNTGINPFIFRYQPKDSYFNLFAKIQPGKATEVLPAIEKLFKEYEQEGTFEFSYVNEALNNTYRDDKRTASIILFFANLTIFIGCLGLFGLTVFSAEQRIKEVGIRKVLGASVSSITALLSKDFIKLVLIAILIAIPVAWYATSKWLESYVYRIQIEWWGFVLIAIAVLAVALFTICIHAIKAALANPALSLRNE
ncbi:MAG: ABC transporter permease [Bacteroidota bacterium]